MPTSIPAAAAAAAAAAVKHAALLSLLLSTLALLLLLTILSDLYLRYRDSSASTSDPEAYTHAWYGEAIDVSDEPAEIHPLAQAAHAIKFFTVSATWRRHMCNVWIDDMFMACTSVAS